jgi:hypothetical protein
MGVNSVVPMFMISNRMLANFERLPAQEGISPAEYRQRIENETLLR